MRTCVSAPGRLPAGASRQRSLATGSMLGFTAWWIASVGDVAQVLPQRFGHSCQGRDCHPRDGATRFRAGTSQSRERRCHMEYLLFECPGISGLEGSVAITLLRDDLLRDVLHPILSTRHRLRCFLLNVPLLWQPRLVLSRPPQPC